MRFFNKTSKKYLRKKTHLARDYASGLVFIMAIVLWYRAHSRKYSYSPNAPYDPKENKVDYLDHLLASTGMMVQYYLGIDGPLDDATENSQQSLHPSTLRENTSKQ